MKLLFELSTPNWVNQFGVSDEGFCILQTASTFPTLDKQEAYITEHAKKTDVSGILNALTHAHDKGLL